MTACTADLSRLLLEQKRDHELKHRLPVDSPFK
eukprot:COSAG02_NODE_29064_length_576_cov_1.509434_1_plen_32_part_10